MKFTQAKVKTIIHDYIHDNLSERDRKAFVDWYNNRSLAAPESEDAATFNCILDQVAELDQKSFLKFQEKLKERRPVFFTRTTFFRIAASLTIFFTLAASVYFFSEKYHSSQFVVLVNPQADTSFYLPDNSKLFLKKGSVVTLSKNFGKENRSLQLSGEARFEVVPSPHEFTVITPNGHFVRVLGTVFHVKAIDELTRVIVDKGRVAVGQYDTVWEYLSRGDRIDIRDEKYLVRRSDSLKIEEDLLVYSSLPLRDVLVDLEDKFGVDISYSELRETERSCTATFDKTQSINQILQILGELYQFDVTYVQETYILKSK